MEYERQLYYDLSGEDVRYIKNILLELGMYGTKINTIQRDGFGSDTLKAVCAFQKQAGLIPNGVIDRVCWEAMTQAAASCEKSGETVEKVGSTLPPNIGAKAQTTIGLDLSKTGRVQSKIVLDALSFAYDPTVPGEFPLSLYIRGGNLYNRDLKPNVITLARIASGAESQPAYYSDGRREMMEAAEKRIPPSPARTVPGAWWDF